MVQRQDQPAPTHILRGSRPIPASAQSTTRLAARSYAGKTCTRLAQRALAAVSSSSQDFFGRSGGTLAGVQLFESQPHRPRSALLKLDQRKADVSGMAGNHADACVHHIIAGCVSFQVFAAVAVHLEHRQSATGGPERLRRWDSLAISGRNYGNRRTEPNAVRVVGQSCGSTPLHDRQSFGELILVAGSDVCVAKDNAHQSSRVASRYANAGGDADADLTYIHCALAGQEVRSALNPSVFAVDALVRSLSSQRFADSRGVFQQNMTLTHQREKQKSQPVVGHHLDRTDVLLQRGQRLLKRILGQKPRLCKPRALYQFGI